MDFTTIPTMPGYGHVKVTVRPSYIRVEDDRGKLLVKKGKRIEVNKLLKAAMKMITGAVILKAEEIKRRHLGPIVATGYSKDDNHFLSIAKVYFRRK